MADDLPIADYALVDDDSDGDEGAFFACPFWLAGNGALQGHTLRARRQIGEIVTCANEVGLTREGVDSATGELLGNSPQGFFHMASVDALMRLERCIDRHGPQ